MRLKLVVALTLLSGLAYLIYAWIDSLPTSSDQYPAVKPTVAVGERLFWGRGRCHVCHRVGNRGYALRGPNLGLSSEGPAIGLRAEKRARETGLKSGAEYLIKSIVEPGAFLVPNYRDEMPNAFAAPIALSIGEIQAVVLYLQSLGGDTSRVDIAIVNDLLRALKTSQPESDFTVRGDSESGRQLFFDVVGPAACVSCHASRPSSTQPVQDLGPDLSALATFRTARHIYEKIVNPDSNIVSGYEQVLVRTLDTRFYVGTVESDFEKTLVLRSPSGERRTILKQEIETVVQQTGTSMPRNYSDLLTEQQLHDLVSYLLTLKGD